MNDYKNVPDFFRENAEKDNKTEAEILAQKANQAISGLKEQYLEQTKEDVRIMKDLLLKAQKAEQQKRFKFIREDFFIKVHDMKGQGSTFGYPLLTEVGAYACDFLRNKKEITDADLTVLKQVVKDAETVLEEDLMGTGGQIGADIRERLEKKDTL